MLSKPAELWFSHGLGTKQLPGATPSDLRQMSVGSKTD